MSARDLAGLFGRYQVAEPLHNLLTAHRHDGVTPLKEVDHQPHVGILDQSDLIEQGILVHTFIPGAARVDALGSCTANATTYALSNMYDEAEFCAITKNLAGYDTTGAANWADVVGAEKAAIGFYHFCTDQTGDPAQEWPPTDCGSTGPYIFSALQRLKLASQEVVVSHGPDLATNLVSAMQRDGVLTGQPFLNAWMNPDAQGFVDGNGKVSTIEAQIALGVAGGHETYAAAVEKLTLYQTGLVDPFNTVLRVPNSWSESFGDHGCFRIHLSSYVVLGQYCDFRQPVK